MAHPALSLRLRSAVRDPVRAGWTVRSRLVPATVWDRYERQCRRAGIDRPTFVLSFDCDTDLDARVVSSVHGRLSAAGITPTYAVPGELLERGASEYGALVADGAELMNHGYRQHTTVDADRQSYVSSFFYDDLPVATVEEDVRRGHATVASFTGAPPLGFRTPHFGSFQSRSQLDWLHRLLSQLGYRYSSSTSPLHGFRRGLARSPGGVAELPVTGCPTMPLGILDSFGFRFAPGRRVDADDYLREAGMLAAMLEAGRPILVNLYADPSQVHDWPGFFSVMQRFAPFAAPSLAAVAAMLR